MNPDLLAIESLVAVSGVINPKLTPAKVEQSFSLIEKMKKRLRSWILNPEQRPFEVPKEHDHQKLFEKLGRDVDIDTSDIVGSPFDGQAVNQKLKDARAALVRRYPITIPGNVFGDLPLDLSSDEIEDWLSLVAIIDDPEWLIWEVEMTVITADQVSIFREVFPAMMDELVSTAHETVIELSAKGEEPTDSVEGVLLILMRAKDPPKITPRTEEKPKTPQGETKLESEGQETSAERASRK